MERGLNPTIRWCGWHVYVEYLVIWPFALSGEREREREREREASTPPQDGAGVMCVLLWCVCVCVRLMCGGGTVWCVVICYMCSPGKKPARHPPTYTLCNTCHTFHHTLFTLFIHIAIIVFTYSSICIYIVVVINLFFYKSLLTLFLKSTVTATYNPLHIVNTHTLRLHVRYLTRAGADGR